MKDFIVSEPMPKFERIGRWSEVKLELLRKYSGAYSKILRNQGFTYFYIDGFAGRGKHESRTTGEIVPGSPLNALRVEPPFSHYFFVELKKNRARILRRLVANRSDVTVYEGDCNRVLIEEVLPQVKYSQFRRALCFLDPYGLHLDWNVISMAGALETVDLFLNFPVMDMNMNALLHHPERVTSSHGSRMTAFWGDETWRTIAYQPSLQQHLFETVEQEKKSNEAVVAAFCDRLRTKGNFPHVASPLAMRNSSNAVVYYIVFASQKKVAADIASSIFRAYERRGSGGPGGG